MFYKDLPLTIATGEWRGGHIQGIALDRKNGFIYCSFTTELVKLDLSGNVIGSTKGFTGHLGCLAMGADGRIWGSLEYKNDMQNTLCTSVRGPQPLLLLPPTP